MFGFIRFFLAFLVVFNHLGNGSGFLAQYAVWFFYTLSGFLMTYVAKNKYVGIKHKYFINRFFRIFPAYWIVFFLTLFVLYFGLGKSNSFHNAMVFPSTFMEWIKNTFIIGLKPGPGIRVVPPAWALSIEIVYYILIGLIIYRKPYYAKILLFISMVYFCSDLSRGFQNYISYISCGIPFSIGSLCAFYFKKDIIQFKISYWKGVFLFSLIYIVFFYLIEYFRVPKLGVGLLINEIFVVGFIFVGWYVKKNDISKVELIIDKLLGELSYPVYLIHWLVGYTLFIVFNIERGYKLLLLSIIPVIFCSYLITIIEGWIKRKRNDFSSSC